MRQLKEAPGGGAGDNLLWCQRVGLFLPNSQGKGTLGFIEETWEMQLLRLRASLAFITSGHFIFRN